MRTSIWIFFGIAFGVGYAFMFGLQFLGLVSLKDPSVYQVLLLGVILYIPALAAFVAAQFEEAPDEIPNRVFPIPVTPAIQATVAVPIIFLAYNLVCWLLSLTEPQWGLGTLMQYFGHTQEMFNQPSLDPSVAASAPWLLLVAYPVLSAILGATFYAAVALGTEYAWRGFLLPRLLWLGRFKAYAATGILSAAWFLPLIIGWYQTIGEMPQLPGFTARFVILVLIFSFLLGQLWTATASAGLCAVALGAFMSHLEGLWGYLFPRATPPWTGPFGIVAIVIWLVFAVVLLFVRQPRALRRTSVEQATATDR